MKKTYQTPTGEMILVDAAHIYTIVSGGAGGWSDIDSVSVNDMIFK